MPNRESFTDLRHQIANLSDKAVAVRKAEIEQVVANVRHALQLYELTLEELVAMVQRKSGGARKAAKPAKAAPPAKRAKLASKRVVATAKRYADGNGNTWAGMGRRPPWLRAALEAGGSLESFLVTEAPAEKAVAKPAKKSKPVKRSQTRYRDEAGNAWSGRGPKPGWLRAAIEAGKTLESFSVT